MGLFDFLKKKKPETPQSTMGVQGTPIDSGKSIYNRKVKVAGVSFPNDNGTSRQKYLADIYNKRPPFNKRLDVSVEQAEYEGEIGYKVFVNGYQVGWAEKQMAQFMTANQTRLRGVSYFRVNYDEDHKLFYAFFKIAVESKS